MDDTPERNVADCLVEFWTNGLTDSALTALSDQDLGSLRQMVADALMGDPGLLAALQSVAERPAVSA